MGLPRTTRSIHAFAGVLLFVAVAAGCEEESSPVDQDSVPSLAGDRPGEGPGPLGAARSGSEFYLATVAPEGDSRVRGTARFEIAGGKLTATVRLAGLTPNERIPQHVHVNPTCDPAGGILINLDEGLTVGEEGPGFGEAYPRANRGGVLRYQASRALDDLEAALMEHQELGLDELELGSRNVNFHEPAPPPIPSEGCGEIRRIN